MMINRMGLFRPCQAERCGWGCDHGVRPVIEPKDQFYITPGSAARCGDWPGRVESAWT